MTLFPLTTDIILTSLFNVKFFEG